MATANLSAKKRTDSGKGAARKLRSAQYKQEIANDRPGDRSFYEIHHPGTKRKPGNDKLREISQGCIQQTAHR